MRNIALYTGRRDIVFLLGERTNEGSVPERDPAGEAKKEREREREREKNQYQA